MNTDQSGIYRAFTQTLHLLMMTSHNNTDNSESTSFKSLKKMLLSESVPLITVQELRKIQEEVTILDTRQSEEFLVSRIRGSEHVGYKKFDINKVNHIAKDEKIVVYCSVGYRSEKIGERMQDAGYSNVRNLYGGIFAWVNQHQPVVNNQGELNRVHPYSLFWGTFITNDTIITTYGKDS